MNFGSMSFCSLQVVDSKATVKRTTKPRRSSRTLNVENGSELTSTVNGRATSGPYNGEQENRGLYGLVISHIVLILFASIAFFSGLSSCQSSCVSKESANEIVCSFESKKTGYC